MARPPHRSIALTSDPATGKEVTLVGCIVVHVVDGKIVEEFEQSDYLGFLQQLDVVPPLG